MRKTTLPVEWETVVLLHLQYCTEEGTVCATYQLQDWCLQQLSSALLTELIMMLNYTGCPAIIQCVPLATVPRISLIILTPMKILQ